MQLGSYLSAWEEDNYIDVRHILPPESCHLGPCPAELSATPIQPTLYEPASNNRDAAWVRYPTTSNPPPAVVAHGCMSLSAVLGVADVRYHNNHEERGSKGEKPDHSYSG
jgi:hypothetical protein